MSQCWLSTAARRRGYSRKSLGFAEVVEHVEQGEFGGGGEGVVVGQAVVEDGVVGGDDGGEQGGHDVGGQDGRGGAAVGVAGLAGG